MFLSSPFFCVLAADICGIKKVFWTNRKNDCTEGKNIWRLKKILALMTATATKKSLNRNKLRGERREKIHERPTKK